MDEEAQLVFHVVGGTDKIHGVFILESRVEMEEMSKKGRHFSGENLVLTEDAAHIFIFLL